MVDHLLGILKLPITSSYSSMQILRTIYYRLSEISRLFCNNIRQWLRSSCLATKTTSDFEKTDQKDQMYGLKLWFTANQKIVNVRKNAIKLDSLSELNFILNEKYDPTLSITVVQVLNPHIGGKKNTCDWNLIADIFIPNGFTVMI